MARPTSSNGASSLHLWWEGAVLHDDVVAASVTLTVLEAPPWPDLCFWALQASFADDRGHHGAAHLGLQWYARHPGSTAVSFGGYRDGGGELDGSASSLPSATGNPNTRDYGWVPGQPYRLEIAKTADRTWTGRVDGREVRTLSCPGSRLAGFVVWTECFADCAAEPSAVRWSDPQLRLEDGMVAWPSTYRVGYQTPAAGGCATGTSEATAVGVVQRTGVARTTPDGARLSAR